MPLDDELYQQRILDHYEEPFHRGRCPAVTHAHEDENPLCGDTVRVERSPAVFQLVEVAGQAYYDTLREKLDGPAVTIRLARLAFLRGETDEAIRLADAAATQAASLNASAEEQAFDLYVAGEYRWHKGDIAGADARYQASLAIFPNYYLALAGRGRAAFAGGAGEQHFRRAHGGDEIMRLQADPFGRRRQAHLFERVTQGRLNRAVIPSVDLAAGKSDLAGMGSEIG